MSVVIPAYNEEYRILNVLNVVKKSNFVDEIIVVNDGSNDRTSEIALKAGAKVINLDRNYGKGKAMKIGVENSRGNIILFLDADLQGLTCKHIEDLLLPVIEGKVDMTISYRDNSNEPFFKIDIFSGERAIKREIFENIKGLENSRFAVEALIDKYIVKNRLKFMNVRCKGLRFISKREKMKSRIKGAIAFYKMYLQIFLKVPNIFFIWLYMAKNQIKNENRD
ncbi:MAG: glycosyltransferase family 2 protein [Candidatus Omnitrophica bacterium]|nr:glycosyltransferase family 2 protein [Candidatus Omnitrophota bacterium]MCM8807055.1 glycosyltransferase family 2 protein [Candidatus Omnitrophota bacterium]